MGTPEPEGFDEGRQLDLVRSQLRDTRRELEDERSRRTAAEATARALGGTPARVAALERVAESARRLRDRGKMLAGAREEDVGKVRWLLHAERWENARAMLDADLLALKGLES